MSSMSHKRTINKETFDEIFHSFSNEYEKLNGATELNIYLVGGAAILLNFDYRKSTMDVDALYIESELVNKAIKNTSTQLLLVDDWLNRDFENTPSYSPNIVSKSKLLKKYGKYINVFTLEPKYLIAMKLKSSRPTGGDLNDIIKMIYELRYKEIPITYEETIEAYKELYKDFSNTYDSFLAKTKAAFDTPIEEVKEIVESPTF